VREAVLQYYGRGDATNRPVLVQGRTNVLLTADLMALTMRSRLRRAVLVTGCADLVPLIEAVKSEGVTVTLFHGEGGLNPARDLWHAAEGRVAITHPTLHRVAVEVMHVRGRSHGMLGFPSGWV
jgi:uncharacterized LabA/DUF88 family protein